MNLVELTLFAKPLDLTFVGIIFNILNVFLGLFGSLLLAYDFIGVRQLERFLYVAIPATLGGIFGIVYTIWIRGLIVLWITHNFDISAPLGSHIAVVLTGMTVGAFNGFFLRPHEERESPKWFSPRNATVGAGIALLFSSLALIVNWYAGVENTIADAIQLVFFVLALGIVSGFVSHFIYLTNNRTAHKSIHSAFSLIAAVLGAIAGLMIFVIYDFGYLFFGVLGMHLVQGDSLPSLGIQGVLGDSLYRSLNDGVIFGLLPGALIGGLTRNVFDWANTRSEHWIAKVGLFFIVAAFVFQAVDPLIGLRSYIP